MLCTVENTVRVVLLRLVPEHDNGLPLDVHVGVVVVFVILVGDAVADKYQR